MDNLKKHFEIDFEEETTYGFSALFSNYFVKEVLNKQNDSKSIELFFRLFRTGLIGDILYKKGMEKKVGSDKDTAERQFLAAMFECYVLLVRTIYDYLMHFLKKHHGQGRYSYSDFLKKIKKGDYPEINGRFREYITKNTIFDEVRALRDSIKEKTPHIDIYVKDHKYYVTGIIYERNGNTKEVFDEPLQIKIFLYSTGLLLLMSYIAESMTGVSLKEQIEYQKKRSESNDS
jgi:hypothetical protein